MWLWGYHRVDCYSVVPSNLPTQNHLRKRENRRLNPSKSQGTHLCLHLFLGVKCTHMALKAHTSTRAPRPGNSRQWRLTGARGESIQPVIPPQSVASSTGETPGSNATRQIPYPSLAAFGL